MGRSNVMGAVIGAVVALVVAFAVFQYRKTGDFSFIGDMFGAGTRLERLERRMMSELAGTPFQPVFEKFSTAFPAEWESFLGEVDANLQTRGGEEQMRQSAEAFMTRFLTQNAAHIARAEPAVLSTLVARYADAMDRLAAESPAMCASSFNQGRMSSPDARTLSPEAQAALASVTILMMDAIVSGRANPQTYAAVQDQEVEPIFNAMLAAGVPEESIVAMGVGTLSSRPVADQCAVGRAFFRALASQPDEFRARFMAFSMAQAAAAAQGAPPLQ